jgi:hypothetical protein
VPSDIKLFMKIKVTIKKGTSEEKAFKSYMEEKKALRKAVENGRVAEYAKKNPGKFATPI